MAYSMPSHGDPTNVMGRRIAAFLIDAVIALAVFVAVLALTKSHSYVKAPSNACQSLRDSGFSGQCLQVGSRVYTWKGSGVALGYLGLAVVTLLNGALLQGISGASVGKLILGLRVVDGGGEVCGLGRAFVRTLLLIVDILFCGLVGLITASVTHPHRRVGDMAGGTYVVGIDDVGRRIAAAEPAYQPAYQYGYGQPDPGGWAPPGGAAPGWGTPPAQAPAAPPNWGAPPPPPEQQGWGQPPAPAAAPGWGQQPPAAPPTWSAPPQPESAPGWGAPPQPENAPAWGAPTPPPPAPEPAAPNWGAPPPPPPPVPEPAAPNWGAPPAPSGPPSSWGEPAPSAPAPLPTRNAPPQPAPAPDPEPTSPPPAVTETPPPPPAPAPAAPKTSPAQPGESWWDKAFSEDDEEPRQ
jgi:uncharacterized RDD family membrane protein YckC